MSKIALNSNASGTGVFTIASPNSDTDRTLSLPDQSGTVALTANTFGYNIIINGDGSVNQRGYTSGTATTGANEYTLDRWRVVTSGESLTFTGNEAGRIMTAPSGGVEQVIEGRNIAGGTYAISWTGTATGAVDGTTVSNGDTVTLTANTNSTIKFTSGTFTNVKVEKGDVATPFEHCSFGEELMLCQRYFWTLIPRDGRYATTGALLPLQNYTSTSDNTFIAGTFPQEMRSSPTITHNLTTSYNINTSAGWAFREWYVATRGYTSLSIIPERYGSTWSIRLGNPNGNATVFYTQVNDNTVYVDFDAEL